MLVKCPLCTCPHPLTVTHGHLAQCPRGHRYRIDWAANPQDGRTREVVLAVAADDHQAGERFPVADGKTFRELPAG